MLRCITILLSTMTLTVFASLQADFGQVPGERQRFRVLGPTRTYTVSQSWIEVSYSDLTHNAGKVLYQLGPDVIPLAIVQGNGYGHGLDTVAKAFLGAGFKELGVADINEAITLRQEGVEVPIHIIYQPDFLTARVMALENVEVYIEDLSFARVLCEETTAVKREAPMQVHVKAALGAAVQGVSSLEEAMELIEYINTCSSLQLRGITTEHAEPKELEVFAEKLRVAGAKFGVTGVAASPKMLRDKEAYGTTGIVHVSAALYGQQEIVKAGDMLHEGHHAKRDMTVAVIYQGYTDAFQVDEVAVRGKLCQRVDLGNSMRVTIIDVTAVPLVQVGDVVLLHGKDGSIELKKPWNLAAVSIGVPRIPKWD
ncbi:hypothetical protein COCSUDRAFT_66312 [Coccomyxa subellipsoidea C-169]|uniref:Alanine racemase n=1 Tax=Coccomyxa subellipsoidea (strain C-169) TaxID=574566 RepID=I0YW49_COCSC|nr:hypothetical protein COCSUDRAFT_66312 [Coccomyxa subellipsoidea C-169]EIE22618.1 hypothetical protein COCSUDRAFT_66312 [Coccomyxa subellipsoidea C-169]|eukprot:XP_005647162.1 hypothetical protein COCSUDRAFT_66312 [Coccomyxa subellipsoidea C-169]